jgi:hypothetical protein
MAALQFTNKMGSAIFLILALLLSLVLGTFSFLQPHDAKASLPVIGDIALIPTS